jgi:hypothetical protein
MEGVQQIFVLSAIFSDARSKFSETYMYTPCGTDKDTVWPFSRLFKNICEMCLQTVQLVCWLEPLFPARRAGLGQPRKSKIIWEGKASYMSYAINATKFK